MVPTSLGLWLETSVFWLMVLSMMVTWGWFCLGPKRPGDDGDLVLRKPLISDVLPKGYGYDAEKAQITKK